MNSDRERSAVGYRRPPAQAQFRPGRSGNPKGRPKKIRTFRQDLEEELRTIISIRINDQEVEVTKQRAIAMALVGRAMKAEARAMSSILELIVQDEEDPNVGTVSPTEASILAEYVNQEIVRRSQEADDGKVRIVKKVHNREERES